MIRALPKTDRARARRLARRQWRVVFMPIGILDLQGLGRSLVVMHRLETRWSETHRRRQWRTLS